MSPPVESFHPSKLEAHIPYKPDGVRRKVPVKLEECQLKEMIQYKCELDGPTNSSKSRIVCEPILRMFRECAGGLTIEVTSFQDIYNKQSEDGP